MKNNIKKKLKYKYILFTFITFIIKVNAQQNTLYTQYMYNTLTINSGYTGSPGTLEAVLLHRSQWIGIDGAPRTQSFTIHSPLKKDQMGLGLSAINDQFGPAHEIHINGNFSYTLPISNKTKLGLGLNSGFRVFNIDWTKGSYYDSSDIILNQNITNKIKPSLGAGAYLYTDKYYIGASIPNFIRSDSYDQIKEAVSYERLSYYLIGGYVFDLSSVIIFKPAFLMRAVSGAPINFDISANFLIQKKVTIGVSYRVNDAISALAGFQISPGFFIGYAYDYSTTHFHRYNDGSHEIIVRYQLSSKKQPERIVTPRFF